MFNAVVQPFLLINEQQQEQIPPAKQPMRQRFLQSLHKHVSAAVEGATGNGRIGHEVDGECVAHFQLQVDSLLDALKDYATDLEKNDLDLVLKDEQQTRFNQLIRMLEPAVFVPQYFFFPLWVNARGLHRPLFVGSLPRLMDELKILDRVLNLYIPDNMPLYLAATEEDLEDYPFGRGGELWINLGYIFMFKLAESALEHDMPLMINF